MPDTQLLQQSLRKFSSLAGWDLPSLERLEEYLLAYEEFPSYKKLLYSMIWYRDMYHPLSFSWKKKLYSPQLKPIEIEENVRRVEKRAQIYMSKRKLIRTRDEKGEKRIVVTSRGEKVFYQDYPLARLRKQKWDGTWTIVMYDFPEEKRKHRNYLREELGNFGFGGSQLSIYISPLPLAKPIQQLIEGKNYTEHVWVTQAKTVLGKSNREIALQTWPLTIINNLYHRLSETFVHVIEDPNLEWFWKACFLAVDHQNPYLPLELLPVDWKEDECRKLFKQLTKTSLLTTILG